MRAPEALIAIVGLACRLPGAPTPNALWQLLCEGRDALCEVPGDRWIASHYVDSDRRAPGKMVTARGGFLDAVDGFDPEFFGISAREAVQIDPQQRLALELSWEALEHAGVAPDSLRDGDASVFMGAMWMDYEKLHGVDDIEQHSGTGWHLGVVPGRVSHALGLRGPSMAVNTACSSSLVAVHLACQALRSRETSIALAGGVSLMLAPHVGVAMSKFGGTSASGRCFAYDARADGYVRGEGGGVVVLRRLEDALASGDQILALIRASAVNSDGHSDSLTVPSEAAQRSLLREVYARAQIEPGSVSFVEGHGTGTAIGDPIEARAIGAELGLGHGREAPLWLGSIKPNIGHTEAASGVASLIKVALALDAGVIPPNRNFEQPNPAIDFQGLRLQVPTVAQPWVGPRIAGVNSFGFGGTNCHVVLSAPGPQVGPQVAPKRARLAVSQAQAPGLRHLVAISAHQRTALDARLEQLRELASTRAVELEDLAHTLWQRRAHLGHRATIVARTLDELVERLERGPRASARAVHGHARPKLAFAFSGQGSQWAAMGRELVEIEPAFRDALTRCSSIIESLVGWSPVDAVRDQTLARHLEHVDGIQPAIYAIQVALAQTWRALGVTPDVVVGHSMGEVAAAVTAGAISVEDGARITCSRATLLRRICGRGGMLSLALNVAETEHVLAKSPLRYAGVCVAVDSGAGSTVVSGELGGLARLREDLEASRVECRDVAVDVAAHSPQIDALAGELLAAIEDIRPRPTSVRMISSVTGAEVDYRELQPAYWVRNLRDPVCFASAAELLFDAGCSALVELSPHPLLTWPLRQIAKARGLLWTGTGSNNNSAKANGAVPSESVTIVGSMRRGRPDHELLLEAAGWLHCRGVPIDLEQPGRLVALPAYPWQRRRFWPRRRRAQERAHELGADVDVVARFDPARVEVLAAHTVGGRPIVAAGVALELVLRAHAMIEPEPKHGSRAPSPASPGPALRFEQLEFAAPIPGDGRVRLELGGGMFSLGPIDAPACVFGRVAPLPVTLTERCGAAPTPSDTTTELDAEQHHQLMSAHGVDYRPSLRAIASVRRAPGSARARLRPGCGRAAVFDAAFQTVLAAIGDDAGYVTARLGAATIDIARVASAHAIEARITRMGDGEVDGRAWLLDEDERVVASFVEVHLTLLRQEASVLRRRRWRKVRSPIRGRLGPNDRVERERTPAAAASSRGSWLLLGPADRALQAALAAVEGAGLRGREVTSVEPSPALDGVIVAFAGARALTLDGRERSAPFEATTEACTRLLHAIQAAVEHDLRVIVVTERAQAVTATEHAALGPSALLAMVRVATTEHPDLNIQAIDLGDLDDAAQLEALGAELRERPDSLTHVALRPGDHNDCERLTFTLEPEVVPSVSWEPRAGTVIVSGGLGGIGRAVVTWLVERGVERVLIVGRSAIGDEGARFIDALAARGRSELLYAAIDVAEIDDLRVAVEPLASGVIGVIHTAAVLSDAPIVEHTQAQLRAALRPKLLGAWNLHELTRGESLDFFVMFGSLGGWIGLPGQCSYAAANAALDGLASHRRALGLPAVSVGWCGWDGLGMARSAGGAVSLERLAADGVGSLSPDEALTLCDHLLAGHVAPVVAVMPPVASAAAEDHARAELLAELRALPPIRRQAIVGDRVLAEVAAVLREDLQRIDPTRPLRDLGLDSLMSVELAERLVRALGVAASTTLIWQYPTIDALVAYFVEQTTSLALDGPEPTDPGLGSGPAQSPRPPGPDPAGSDPSSAAPDPGLGAEQLDDEELQALVGQLDELSDEEVEALASAL